MQVTEVEIPQTFDELLQTLDKTVEGKPGIKPSDAWKYREEVRAKYGLPECGLLVGDPLGYIQMMEEFLKRERVEVRNNHEFSLFFKENSESAAFYFISNVFREATIAVPGASESVWFDLMDRATQLAHESVHAMQGKHYPRMPFRLAEKEAYYYQMLKPQIFLRYKDKPDFIMHFINETIEDSIRSSVEIAKRI